MSNQPGGDPAPASSDTETTTPEAPAKARLFGRGNIITAVVAVVIIAAIVALNVIHVPVAILRPGPVTNTLGTIDGKPVIQIDGAKRYPATGNLDFTTVSMAGGPQYPVSVMEWLRAKLDSNAEIDPESEWFQTGVTSQEVQQQGNVEMTNSQETAEVVALRAAGYTVPEKITVAGLEPKAAATGYFTTGDVLVSLGGHPVTTLDSISSYMSTVTPGSKVAVVVTRSGKRMTLQVPTANDGSGHAVFGIEVVPSYTFPVKITVNAGDVGGPSAGTMFTLGIYDLLTSGSLTGGNKIAGTGTMAEDGTVGPIGGIRQKMLGAKGAGAKFFLAPDSDCSEAKGHIPSGLTVIEINSFSDALTVVKEIAAGKTSGFPGC
ncbi:YlbL family protein [Rudaeicoccus suwonensis]|uniref:YlbL family protein n=1 Tax=Rudaeicoccus suwonensis TaxID=657409 RepID=UPI00119D2396|nr:S16 family serine protease [Rudaeicoccus suwonensis]